MHLGNGMRRYTFFLQRGFMRSKSDPDMYTKFDEQRVYSIDFLI
jgi:hypothetical protein